jgi:microcystin-dependent protein
MRSQIAAAVLAAALMAPIAATAARAQPPPAATYLGEVRAFGFNFCPTGWLPADGRLLPIMNNQPLFSLLGLSYGGDGRTNFALPNLQGATPIGATAGGAIGQPATAAPGAQHRFLTMTWCVAVQGTYPQHP